MRLSLHAASVALAVLSSACSAQSVDTHQPIDDETWARAQAEARARIERQIRPQQARNVILFVADGMSVPTITAARIFDGQQNGAGTDDALLLFLP